MPEPIARPARFLGTCLGVLFSLSFLCLVFPQAVYSDDKEPSLEEIAKTDAAKLFVAKQYQAALEEFKKLETQYPKSVLIKRYIGSLYDSLRRWDDAVTVLKQALSLNSQDVIVRQMLGDIYVKQANLDDAAREFQSLLSQNPDGPAGKYAGHRLEEIDKLKAMPRTEQGKRMAAQDFMKSKPAQDFAKGKYQEAFNGFEELMAPYPEDMLIRRFRGITLMRLGKSKEAIHGFEEALQIAPDNTATHFYLAQAYLAEGKMEEARKEYQWVIAHDETSYRLRAQGEIFRTLGKPAAAPKRLTVSLTNAYDYDTNAVYKSRDDRVSQAGDKNSGRYTSTLVGSYRLHQIKKWTFTGDALYTQTLYDDFPNLQTYTSGAGISALYNFNFFKKPAFLNIREGATHTLLKNKFYVWSNAVSSSFIVIPHKRLRTTVTYRWTASEFDNDGTDNDVTSRDGFANSISLSNVIYLNNARTLYTTVGYEYEHADTTGVNYRKSVHGANLALHFPMIEKVEGDFNFKFKDSFFPKYAYGPPGRRDDQYTFTVSVSRPLTKRLTLTGNYVFDDTDARNNVYEYRKQLFGVQLALKY